MVSGPKMKISNGIYTTFPGITANGITVGGLATLIGSAAMSISYYNPKTDSGNEQIVASLVGMTFGALSDWVDGGVAQLEKDLAWASFWPGGICTAKEEDPVTFWDSYSDSQIAEIAEFRKERDLIEIKGDTLDAKCDRIGNTVTAWTRAITAYSRGNKWGERFAFGSAITGGFSSYFRAGQERKYSQVDEMGSLFAINHVKRSALSVVATGIEFVQAPIDALLTAGNSYNSLDRYLHPTATFDPLKSDNIQKNKYFQSKREREEFIARKAEHRQPELGKMIILSSAGSIALYKGLRLKP